MKVIFIALLGLLSATYAACHSDDTCQSLRRFTDEQCGQPVISQGRPGKLGPPGPKGSSGASCGSSCDPSEVEELSEKIRVLNESFQAVYKLLKQNIAFCGVGIRDGRVRDEDLTESSSYGADYRARYARLDDTRHQRGFWHADHDLAGEWVQVDLKSPTRVLGVITQGRPNLDYWTSTFKISYGNSIDNLQAIIGDDGAEVIFQGNTDRNSHVTNTFPQPITARYFRLVVVTFNGWPVLRMEYLIC